VTEVITEIPNAQLYISIAILMLVVQHLIWYQYSYIFLVISLKIFGTLTWACLTSDCPRVLALVASLQRQIVLFWVVTSIINIMFVIFRGL
jgi:hypothetical protein